MTTEELIKRFYEEAQDDTESMYWIAADRIEQLEAEIERIKEKHAVHTLQLSELWEKDSDELKHCKRELREITEKWKSMFNSINNDFSVMEEQLAAHESTIKTMREALEKNQSAWNTMRDYPTHLPERLLPICKVALSLPTPTDHLMTYRESVLEEAAKRCESFCHGIADDCAEVIRAMKEKK